MSYPSALVRPHLLEDGYDIRTIQELLGHPVLGCGLSIKGDLLTGEQRGSRHSVTWIVHYRMSTVMAYAQVPAQNAYHVPTTFRGARPIVTYWVDLTE